MDITWSDLQEFVIGAALSWAAVSVLVALLIGGMVKLAESKERGPRCQFCGGTHEGLTTLCTDQFEESSDLG